MYSLIKIMYLFTVFFVITVTCQETNTTSVPCGMMCECNIKKCINELKIMTKCTNKKSVGMKCLMNMTESENCPRKNKDKEIMVETNVLYKQYNGLTYAEKTICHEPAMHLEYKKKPYCWYLAVQCSQLLGFQYNDEEINCQFCRRKELVIDQCKEMENIEDSCKDIHVRFVDAMFRTTVCRNFHGCDRFQNKL